MKDLVIPRVRIEIPDVPAPEGWKCTWCGEGDTPEHPAIRVDLSTSSFTEMPVVMHHDCWSREMEKVWYGGGGPRA